MITVTSVALTVGSLGFKGDRPLLDVQGDVVSISEIRPLVFVPKSLNESLKRKLNKEKLRSLPGKLARDARWLAQHGGVTGTCSGCATARMKQLVKALIIARFAPVGPSATQTVLCLAEKESDFNPGAISDTNDWGTGQINRPFHESDHPSWWRSHAGFKRAVLDPVYNVGIMFAMSKRGTSWTPWTGTYGQGMCH